METFWIIFDVIGLTLLLGLAFVTTYTFYAAFSNETKKVLVDINSVGEANIEAVLVGIVLAWGMVSIGRLMWRLK